MAGCVAGCAAWASRQLSTEGDAGSDCQRAAEDTPAAVDASSKTVHSLANRVIGRFRSRSFGPCHQPTRNPARPPTIFSSGP